MAWILEPSGLFTYPVSYILYKHKWNAHNRELGIWIKHIDVQQSKVLGWHCELCGAKSRYKERYLSSLIQRVRWHVNGRCPVEYKGEYTA